MLLSIVPCRDYANDSLGHIQGTCVCVQPDSPATQAFMEYNNSYSCYYYYSNSFALDINKLETRVLVTCLFDVGPL